MFTSEPGFIRIQVIMESPQKQCKLRSWIFLFTLLSFPFLLRECEKISDPDEALVLTGEPSLLDDGTALLTGKITHHGSLPVTESGFIWGVHSRNPDGIRIPNQVLPADYFEMKTNHTLIPDRTFYARAYVQSEESITFGNEVSFEGPDTVVNRGVWSLVSSTNMGDMSGIREAFAVDGKIYAAAWQGQLTSFDLSTLQSSYLLTDSRLISSDFSLVVDGKAYLFIEDAFYLFNPADTSITRLNPWPDEKATNCRGFALGNKLYVAHGHYAYLPQYLPRSWEYDLETGVWQERAPFAGPSRRDAFTFALDGKGYLGGGSNSSFYNLTDMWCYDPESDSWKEKTPLPVDHTDGWNSGGVYQGMGYMICEDADSYPFYLFEYNALFNTWYRMEDFKPSPYSRHPCLISYGSKLYGVTLRTTYSNIFFIHVEEFKK